MLVKVESFIEDLIADEVIGVNIEDAKECLDIICKEKYPSKEEVKLACEWFNNKGISANINVKGVLELYINGEYIAVSSNEISYRAEIARSSVFCDCCGREVVPDEAENCEDCGTWLGNEIEEKNKRVQ
jgi:hypothetical protein